MEPLEGVEDMMVVFRREDDYGIHSSMCEFRTEKKKGTYVGLVFVCIKYSDAPCVRLAFLEGRQRMRNRDSNKWRTAQYA